MPDKLYSDCCLVPTLICVCVCVCAQLRNNQYYMVTHKVAIIQLCKTELFYFKCFLRPKMKPLKLIYSQTEE